MEDQRRPSVWEIDSVIHYFNEIMDDNVDDNIKAADAVCAVGIMSRYDTRYFHCNKSDICSLLRLRSRVERYYCDCGYSFKEAQEKVDIYYNYLIKLWLESR